MKKEIYSNGKKDIQYNNIYIYIKIRHWFEIFYT